MLKRIIFDIDDTLIINKPEFALSYKEIFNNKSSSLSKALYDVLESYEDEEDIYSEEKMLSFINRRLNCDYDISFVKKINTVVGEKWINKNVDISDTLEYLSSKYELYALTNWFTSSQVRRLELSGILKYFTKVIGADMVKIKPNKEAYLMASENLKMSECLFIGDSPYKDLDVPYKMGAKVIFFDRKKKYKRDYRSIDDINKLKEIL